MKYALTLMLVLSISQLMGQDKIYVGRARGESPLPRYVICELILHSDSTYTRIDYHGTKQDVRNYRNWNSEISSGRLSKVGNHYKIVEYRAGTPGQSFNLRLSEKSMRFLGSDGHLGQYKGMKLKRKEED